MFRQRSEKHRFCVHSGIIRSEERNPLQGVCRHGMQTHRCTRSLTKRNCSWCRSLNLTKNFSKARRCFASTTFSPKAFPMPALPFSWRNWEPKSWAASLSERRSSKCNHHPSLSPLCSRGLKIKIGSAPPGADSLPSPGHFLILSTSFSQAVFLHRDASAEHSPKSDHSPSHQVDGQFFCLFLVSG